MEAIQTERSRVSNAVDRGEFEDAVDALQDELDKVLDVLDVINLDNYDDQ